MSAKNQQQCLELLRSYTGLKNVKITSCGNLSIYFAFAIAKQLGKVEILAPDQGGWISYKTYPEQLDLKYTEIPTEDGVLSPTKLQKHLTPKSTLILNSFAGYAAEQPVEEIAKLCKEHNTLFIEDASAAIGDKTLGKYGDIILGSFGEAKVVDLGFGGFIAAKEKQWFESNLFSINRFPDELYPALLAKLQAAPKRLSKLLEEAEQVKKKLKQYNVLHPEKRGPNVIVAYETDKEKEVLASFCKTHKYEYVLCPKDIKVKRKAISIELKR